MSMEEFPFNSDDRTRCCRMPMLQVSGRKRLGGQSAATELGGGSVATAERHGLLVGEGRRKLLNSVETF